MELRFPGLTGGAEPLEKCIVRDVCIAGRTGAAGVCAGIVGEVEIAHGTT